MFVSNGWISRCRWAIAPLLWAVPVFASASSSAPGPANSNEYSFRVWHSQDGLPQDRIRVISQTSDGYLWIGTTGGLARFDGVRFFRFDRSNTPAFHDDAILSLFPSKDGGLWIGTEGGGLVRYRNGVFTQTGVAEGLSNGFVRALLEDRGGALWIGTDRGFFRLRNGAIERLDNRGEIPVSAVTSIQEEAGGRIWVSTGEGILVAEAGILRRYLPGNPALTGLIGVHSSQSGGLWLQTRNGLRRFENGVLQPDTRLEKIEAVALTEGADQNLWIGSLGEGLIRVNPNGIASYRSPGILPSNTVWSVFEDRERNLWVGTHDGLVRLSKATVQTLGARDGLQDENVSTTYASPDGTLWLTTITGRIYRYSAGRVTQFNLPSPFSHAEARTVFQDSRGDLWVGTGADGAVRLSKGRTGGKTTFLARSNGLRSNSVRQLFEDREGNLWLALGSGLARWDGHQLHNYYVEDGLPYGSVRVVMQDRKGDILVGTDGGLARIHDLKFTADPTLTALSSQRVWALYEDADSALWAGTRGDGLFRIRNDKVSRISVHEGLPDNAIFQILEAGNNLWMSSPSGVFTVSRADLNRVADGKPGPIAVVQHGTADGMASSHMNGSGGWAGTLMPSGEFWFPTVRGAVRIDPKSVRVVPPSPVVIEGIVADEHPRAPYGEIHVPPGHGKLEIDYSASSLLKPERISFKYKLEGFDEDWIHAYGRRAAYYTNLPHGNYKFRVVATDSALPGNASEASLAFTLDPHYYQTMWFYAVCAVAVCGCIWFALSFHVRQTRARYAVLLAERTRLAREMHDTVIQGCVGVSTLLEAASGFRSTDTKRAYGLVDQARSQVRQTLDEARQAVWDLRHTRLEGDICGTLPGFAHQLSVEKGIPIDVETIGSPAPLSQGAIRNLLLVAREAIRNAVTHGNPQHILIQLRFDPGEMRLEVRDDGHGFAQDGASPANGHYGILGMRERVEQLGGFFELNSSPGGGTRVIARMPLGDSALRGAAIADWPS